MEKAVKGSFLTKKWVLLRPLRKKNREVDELHLVVLILPTFGVLGDCCRSATTTEDLLFRAWETRNAKARVKQPGPIGLLNRTQEGPGREDYAPGARRGSKDRRWD